MLLRLRSIAYLAEAINGYELVDPRGRDLPRFAAGAHVAVRHGASAVRDYSLWNDPAERRRYCIAVLRESGGQGSSHWHEGVRVGDPVEVSMPRNNFPLTEEAERYLLLAGGIGITPIMAMIAELRRRGAAFLLHYCTRSPEATAFRDELDLLAAQGRVRFYHDGGDPARGLDIATLLRDPKPGTHLYYCGPAGMMRSAATAAASADWPEGTVHCEYFTGPAARPPAALGRGARVSRPPREERRRIRHSGRRDDRRRVAPARGCGADLVRARLLRHLPDCVSRRRTRPSRSDPLSGRPPPLPVDLLLAVENPGARA